MGVYTAWKDAYKREAVYGTSTITTAGDTTYSIGALSKKSKHPSPTATLHYATPAINTKEVAAGYVWKGKMDCIGSYSVVMQNGILLQLVMGKSATTGPVGGVYTHTITPPTDTTQLSSITWHHERTGTATNWAVQFTGTKVAGLSLLCSSEGRYLIGAVTTVSQKAVDPNLDGTNAMLTNDPVLPPTATTDPYKFTGMTRTWDYGAANTALNGLVEMELNISPDLDKLYTANWTAGVWTGQWPYKILEGARMKYQLTMHYVPESDDIWDDLVTLSNTRELYFKWTKSANDYIAATLTDCQVISHDIITPDMEDPTDICEVIIEPRALSFTVLDTITGATHYGE